MPPKIKLTLVATAFALAVASCTGGTDTGGRGGGSPTDPGRRRVTVSVGFVGEPATLDPYSRHASDLTRALVRPVYPSLFSFMPDGSTRPYLAESLEGGGASVRVTLRIARWSNGRSITARDVVASVGRARAPSGFAGLKAAALGERVVRLSGGARHWERTLATAAYVLPRGRAAWRISGGPYRMVSIRAGLHVVYRPNPQWGGDPPGIRTLEAVFVEGSDLMRALLERGDLDAAAIPATINMTERLEALGLRYDTALGWELVYLDFSDGDLTVAQRAALASAIDLEVLDEGLARSTGRASYTMHPGPGAPAVGGPFESLPRGNGVGRVLITAARGDELLALVQRALQQQLADAGIATELVTVEPRLFYGNPRALPPSVAVRRTVGAPGGRDHPAEVRKLVAFPLLHMASVVAWQPALVGPAANPTVDGPLWNVASWRLGL